MEQESKIVYEAPATVVVEVMLEGRILQASREDDYGVEFDF